MAYFALRPELIFDQLADVKSVNQSMPGSSVTFTIQNDLVAAVTPLSEGTDITTQTLSNSQITVALAEYGSAVTTTAVLRGEAYVEIDPIVANVIGYNAGVSIDSVARNAIGQGTQWKTPSGAALGTTKAATVANVAAVNGGSTVTASYNDILAAQKALRAQNVAPFGSYYAAVIHPDVAYDLQLTNNYLAPHQYAQPAEIWAGEIGALNGFRFIETPRAEVLFSPADDNLIPLTLSTAISAGTVTSIVLAGASATAPLKLAKGATIKLTDSSNANTFTFTVDTAVTSTSATTTVAVASVTSPAFTTANTSVVVLSSGTGQYSPVYTTYFMGRQSLAKVHSIVDGNGPVPKIIPGPITDTLRRYVPLGWYWLGGYSVFRQPAVMQYFTQSSLSNIDPAIDN
jgi:N4-gp56 family major capsid protein